MHGRDYGCSVCGLGLLSAVPNPDTTGSIHKNKNSLGDTKKRESVITGCGDLSQTDAVYLKNIHRKI